MGGCRRAVARRCQDVVRMLLGRCLGVVGTLAGRGPILLDLLGVDERLIAVGVAEIESGRDNALR